MDFDPITYAAVQKLINRGGGMPIGSIIQAPFTLADPAWKRCDGLPVARSLYPQLAALLPSVGTFTATVRTKPAASTSGAVANNGTLWAVTGAVGVQGIYTTPDGITYTSRTTPAAADIRALLYDGTNFIAVNAGGINLYSPTGVTWTAGTVASCIGGATQSCLTNAPTLGASGRLCVASGSPTLFTSDDHGVTWTARSTGLSFNFFHVAWTGTKFIGVGNAAGKIVVSSDGITWVLQSLPTLMGAATAGVGTAISDGAGRVLILGGSPGYMLVSLDHGATWSRKQLVQPSTGTIVNCGVASYSNGRFFVPFSTGWLVSTNLLDWAVVEDNSLTSVGNIDSISYKASVYLTGGQSTSSLTIVEDTTKMYMPGPMVTANSTGSTSSNADHYVKVQ